MRSSTSLALLSLTSTALAFGSTHEGIKRQHRMKRLPTSIKSRADSVVAYYGYQAKTNGACGWLSADTDFIVGLGESYLTYENNDNCGKQVIVSLADDPSKSVTATVTDSCRECDLYLSVAAFEALAGSLDAGSLNVTWAFTDEEVTPAEVAAVAPTTAIEEDSESASESVPAASLEESVYTPDPTVTAGTYTISTTIAVPTVPVSTGGTSNDGWKSANYLTGEGLFDFFNFDLGPADNSGAANYVGRDSGLVYADGDGNSVIAIDTTQVVGLRDSVRMVSKTPFNVGSLIAVDVKQMPATCGVWPAIWLNGGCTWPECGEIDILEGVNMYTQNIVSVHTGNGCSLVESAIDSLTAAVLKTTSTLSCSAYNDPAACGFNLHSETSYGVPFNNVGGGTWATLVTSNGIDFYFWNEGSVPADLVANAPLPSTWGAPLVSVPSTSCDIASNFKDLYLTININLGGSFAGAVWDATGNGQDTSCAARTGFSSAADYISQTGSAFAGEQFTIRSIKTYTQ